MAVRTPLYWNGSALAPMEQADVDAQVASARHQLFLNPVTTLTVVAQNSTSADALPAMYDTFFDAGGYTTRTDRFSTEGETPNIVQQSVEWKRIEQTRATLTVPASTTKSFPVYMVGSGQIKAMSDEDFLDTYIHPAIITLNTAQQTAEQQGTYFISPATNISGATNQGLVYSDTTADATAFQAVSIPEAVDQYVTQSSYNLFQVNGAASTGWELPMYIDGNNNLRRYSETGFNTLLSNWIRYSSSAESGYRISYNITSDVNDPGITAGSQMLDRRLDGTSADGYSQRFVNENDYRTQEFPSGTATTVNTYYFRIIRD